MEILVCAPPNNIKPPFSFSCNNNQRRMSTTREGPNPLRPYYKPPSIGIPQDFPGTTSSGTHGLGPRNGSAASYASSARDILSDIDYTDYGSPSTVESVKKQIDDWVYRYMSILLGQPFDVAKTVLQIRSQVIDDGTITDIKPLRTSYKESAYSDVRLDGRVARLVLILAVSLGRFRSR